MADKRFRVPKGATRGTSLLGIAALMGYGLYKSVYTGKMTSDVEAISDFNFL